MYFLGIDIGTYASKGVLIDAESRCVATHEVPHEMKTPYPGWAEHDAAQDWWGDFCKISNAILEKSGIAPGEIVGVGASAIAPCCLPVDKDLNPLMPAILYGVDVRANKEIDALNAELGEAYVLKKYGNPITSQSVGPKILWVKKHRPEVYEKADKFLTSTSYLVAKLTGEYAVDRYTAAYFTPMYDLAANDWDYANLSRYCRADQMASCHWTDEVVGKVHAKAAAETGILEGTPVICGTADASADAAGVGIFGAGDMLLMFGSSIYIIHVVPELLIDKRFWAGPYLFEGSYMVAAGMSTAGTLTRWFRDNLAPDMVAREKTEGLNAYVALAQEAEDIPPGSGGLITLPYLSGERTPIHDPNACGMIFGLNLLHTRAHLYRSCLEGVGYGIGQHFDAFAEMGMETQKVVAVGGGTKNAAWMQIVADVLGRPMHLGQVFGAAYGDALLAAMGTGVLRREAMQQRITLGGYVIPNAETTKVYTHYKRLYTELYARNKECMRNIATLRQ